ncbi:TPA: DNA cytosine methyltransferase [Burkholderia cepacia]|uniref:DNA cytosine methyltransferase n=1 Tax=Burkholderia cepacia TaxID=292 RepID=UPI001CF11A9A|nr:DNA cytosine methyltransferase [Burkholderia cepacia]HDR9180461.1 DNA cytosine methyltransferase [Burkholderia vietnamiensis]HDR9185863.1 DNA cytosine methyltransferase [Burkholderia vietnamiensis]HDR9759460.1 DNA cytosine methyltransferase [Burkholderia cepacia ATCC 25416]HDV6370070.1 DNA cytosine methyltransferase [Burkholderia cepacia]
MTYTAIDLFSGCGGLSRGLKDAGFDVLGAVEIDGKARETYSLNHADIPLVGDDIRKVSARQLLTRCGLRKGELDLLAGCPPCQGFSTLRVRNGKLAATDSRNDLIDEFARLALGLRPKMIMMENVPALARYDKFGKFVADLKANGYNIVTRVLDVGAFGVPQRRKRLILSASRIGQPQLAAEAASRITVRNAIGHLPHAGQSGDPLHDLTSPRRSARVQAIIEAIPKDGGSRHSLPESLQLNCHANTSGFNDVYGRMKWDDVAPTITSGCCNPSKGRFIHPSEHRPITLREAAVLQGFPIDYQFNLAHGKESISLMIGNALPPPFIAAHSKAIMSALD